MPKFQPEIYDYFLVVDLEATCCDDESIPSQEQEIIEIGAVIIDLKTFENRGEFQTYIKPVRHPILTPFCQQLTKIEQELVEPAPSFKEAWGLFEDWRLNYSPSIFCSWGAFDRQLLKQDCRFQGLTYPFGKRYLNLRTWLRKKHKIEAKLSLSWALEIAGLSREGQPHSGLDDARNLAKLLPFIFGQKSLKFKPQLTEFSEEVPSSKVIV